jgi:hypothetical protein
MVYEGAQPGLIAAGLGEQRIGNVVLVTLRQAPDPRTRGVKYRPTRLAPLLDLCVRLARWRHP